MICECLEWIDELDDGDWFVALVIDDLGQQLMNVIGLLH